MYELLVNLWGMLSEGFRVAPSLQPGIHTQKWRTENPTCKEEPDFQFAHCPEQVAGACHERQGCNWWDAGGRFTQPSSNQLSHWTVGLMSV